MKWHINITKKFAVAKITWNSNNKINHKIIIKRLPKSIELIKIVEETVRFKSVCISLINYFFFLLYVYEDGIGHISILFYKMWAIVSTTEII